MIRFVSLVLIVLGFLLLAESSWALLALPLL